MSTDLEPSHTDTLLLEARWQAFYRAYPWLQARIEALNMLLHPGTKAERCRSVTLSGDALSEARALLKDLQEHLVRCYSPTVHQAFRHGQRAPRQQASQRTPKSVDDCEKEDV